MHKSIKLAGLPILAAAILSQGLMTADTAAAAPGKQCSVPRAVAVGDTVVVSQAIEGGLHWDTTGNVLNLAQQGSGKEIQLVASTNLGGPSSPVGSCLRSGSYIRFASSKHAEPNRYLIAYKAVNPVNVPIGNYPDPQIDSIFYVIKVAGVPTNSAGPEILRGDVINIRGVSHDPWLSYPANAANGSAVLLADDNQVNASPWVFGHFGSDNDGED